MENTLHQLYITLGWLHREARFAYWHHEKHCGSDFNEDEGCPDCQHFNMCQSTAQVGAGLEILDKMVGG